MTSRWTTAVLDTATPGGWAVARSREGFLFDDNGALFPREWLKRQDLSVLAEHGIGHLDGEPVYLLELKSPGDVPGSGPRRKAGDSSQPVAPHRSGPPGMGVGGACGAPGWPQMCAAGV